MLLVYSYKWLLSATVVLVDHLVHVTAKLI